MKKMIESPYFGRVVWFLILAWILAFLSVGAFYIFREKEQVGSKEVAKWYVPVNKAPALPIEWSHARSNGAKMFVKIDGDVTIVECTDMVELKEGGAIHSLYEAPIGELVAFNGKWYIAKVSQLSTSRDKVLRHLESCTKEMENYISYKLAARSDNLNSWSN